jgi:RecB family exonuclease
MAPAWLITVNEAASCHRPYNPNNSAASATTPIRRPHSALAASATTARPPAMESAYCQESMTCGTPSPRIVSRSPSEDP